MSPSDNSFDPSRGSPPLPRMHERRLDSHKGDYGHLLLIGGSRGMAGAISIAAMGALRSGAGLVTVATADVCVDVVASFHPCAMTLALPSDASGGIGSGALEKLDSMAHRVDAMALGPGMGRSQAVFELVEHLFVASKVPMVVDADALFALSQSAKKSEGGTPFSLVFQERGIRVLTPHAGEWERICRVDSGDRTSQIEAAISFARAHSLVILLKGHRTMITDGERVEINETGGPAMATGGSGDCLTGMIGSLLGQGYSGFDSARIAAYWHGLAGDLALKELGGPSVLATDLIAMLPRAYRKMIKRMGKG